MNSRFINALGIVALCYILLQLFTWIMNSLFRITAGLGSWLRYTVAPHAWQIAIAAGVIYLLYTAVTTGGRRV
ncbi:MAG: hypothetical protein MUF72_21820 [Elainella sp. Prado103]|jgi:hypothetical protein|nr:hypothetical protein [Elainella sp. Prado103]